MSPTNVIDEVSFIHTNEQAEPDAHLSTLLRRIDIHAGGMQMTFLSSAHSADSTAYRQSKNLKKSSSTARYRVAVLSLAASAFVMAGCGSTRFACQQCGTQTIHSTTCCSPSVGTQPRYQEAAESPLYQLNEVGQTDQSLLGGSGLASGDSCPIESPVEVAPVPLQFSQPVESNALEPTIEAEPDAMQLEESQIADPMEI